MTVHPQNNGKNDITLHDVMKHLQLHLELMREEFRKVHVKIDHVEKKLSSRIDTLEIKVDRIDHRLILVETKIDNIADTLDTIERIPFIGKEMQKQWKR